MAAQYNRDEWAEPTWTRSASHAEQLAKQVVAHAVREGRAEGLRIGALLHTEAHLESHLRQLWQRRAAEFKMPQTFRASREVHTLTREIADTRRRLAAARRARRRDEAARLQAPA